MRDYETLIQATLVLPKHEPIYSALGTKVTLEDEAAGLFVRVTQEPDEGTQSIAIELEEWPILRAAIDTAVQTCQERNEVQP